MKKLENIYKQSFFSKRYKLQWRANPLCDAVMQTTQLQKGGTIIDVGCAVGEYIQEFKNRGLNAYGIEGSKEAFPHIPEEIRHFVFNKDLRKPFFLHYYFKVVMCLEVAEHIEKEYADQFVSNLINLTDYIIISAAPPGQKGHYHVNCQPVSFWELLFEEYEFYRNIKDERIFKKCLEPHKRKKGLNAYYANTLIFERDYQEK